MCNSVPAGYKQPNSLAMSDCSRPGCSRGGGLLCGVKPRHVRTLNFGQSILELDIVEQCSVPGHVLVIDENVARIPCTKKGDYVRKWLETHENGKCDPSRSCPVLETSATSQRSPVLSKGRKRPRRRVCINRNAAAKRPGNTDRQENAEHSANSMRSKPHCGCKEKSAKWECTSGTQRTPPGREKPGADETSPVLGIASHRVFKKKKRKLQHKPEDSISGGCSTKSRDYKITGVNIKSTVEPDGNRNLRKVLTDQNKLEENLHTKAETLDFSIEVRESPEKYQGYVEAVSSSFQERLDFADSSSSNTVENDSKIETGTSNDGSDSKDEDCDELTDTSNNSNNLSNFIEDTDTQETMKTSQFSMDKNLTPSRQPFTSLQLVIDNLNETYCSEAERVQDQSMYLSARISEVPSLNRTTQKTGSKSTQTDAIISTITTPSRKSPDKSMYAHLLDSGKKRRKPKKGSVVARLQSLVSAQISGIRIWRHRMNKEHDATSAQYISVLVRDSAKQFGNQFLKGILIEDRYNLLRSDIQIEQAETDDAQARPERVLNKNVTIMLVCDIIGTLKIISEVVLNIYPPWNILDKDDLTLEVIYISISNNREISDIENTEKSRKKRILKEFNCPCIEEQRKLPFCAGKPSTDKPDVMQQIFNF